MSTSIADGRVGPCSSRGSSAPVFSVRPAPGTGYTRRIETAVDQRTHDLETVNRRLQLEINDRRHAEAALRQAQRMEAVGQLTGGIAHDFNNLLTVVGGNAALLRDNAPDDLVARCAPAMIRAAEQGERLTRQLRAFSRRQMLRPEPVDLYRRAPDLGEMMSQLAARRHRNVD